MNKAELAALVDAQHASLKAAINALPDAAPTPAPSPTPTPSPTPGQTPAAPLAWDFKDMTGISERPEVDWQIQAKANDRVKLVPNAFPNNRDGIKLTTLPGDSDVFQSGTWQRTDLRLNNNKFQGIEGSESVVSCLTMLPDDYQYPNVDGEAWANAILWTYHSPKSGSQAAYRLEVSHTGNPGPVVLRLRGFAGASKGGWEHNLLGGRPPPKNTQIATVSHVKWHPTAGFVNFYMKLGDEPVEVFNYRGATMYAGFPTYFKLDNYHAPYTKPSSVIHGRVRIGKSFEAVSPFAKP